MTDSLQASGQNKYLTKRWADLLNESRVPDKTGDEIAAEVISRLNLKIKGGDGIG